MTHIAWPEIESFHNIKKNVRAYPELLKGEVQVTYKCKIKLHGTNSAIQVHDDGTVVAQSRSQVISLHNDNAGFAAWVNSTCMAPAINTWDKAKGHIIYGEWAGPSIQKGVALSQIPKKIFAVFAARPLDQSDKLIVEPNELSMLVAGIPDVYVLPWYNKPCHYGCDTRTEKTHIYWDSSDDVLTETIAPIITWVMNIEANDPWVEDTFGVKGTGEGLVFYPVSHSGFENFSNLCFKAKGEKHKNIATAKPVQISAESAASIDAFVDMVLTEARLEQAATVVGGFDLKLTGNFVKWIECDIQKECQDELEASSLEWKQVQKPLTIKSRTWYMEQAKK